MPSPAITRPGASRLEREELRGEHGVGDEADPRHQRAEEGPLPRPAAGRAWSPARRGAERAPAPAAPAGRSARCGRSRRRRPRRRRPPPRRRRTPRRACHGTSAARRRSASPQPALARRQRAADRAGALPEGGRHDHRQRVAGRRPRRARRTWRGRTRSGGRRPAPPRRRARSTPGRAPRPGWPGRSRSTTRPPRMTCCAAGSPAAAAAETSSPRTLSGSPPASRTTSPSRPARAASRARTPSPAPEAKRSQQPRRPQGHGGPAGSTTMWPISPAKPADADLHPPVEHDAAADAGPQRDHDDVAEATGGPQAVLGQHGEVGVVLDQERSVRAAGRRSARSSPRPGPAGRLGAKQSRPWRSTMPGAPTPTGAGRAPAAARGDACADRGRRPPRPPPRPRGCRRWPGSPSGWRPGPRRRCRRRGPGRRRGPWSRRCRCRR